MMQKNQKAHFLYCTADGVVSQYSLFITGTGDNYIEGRCIEASAFRRFLKHRIIKFYEHEKSMNESENTVMDDYCKWLAKKMEISFYGFDQQIEKELQKKAEINNFIVKASVTKELDILCVGPHATPNTQKINKAISVGADLLTKEQFLHFLDSGEIIDNNGKEITETACEEDEIEQHVKMINDCKITFETLQLNQRRNAALIAIFHDGYAAGWVFAVKECYRDALDIKYTSIKRKKREMKIWTQGTSFSFKRGSVFFSHREAYSNWESFLSKPDAIALQIVSDGNAGYETIASLEGSLSGVYMPAKLSGKTSFTDVSFHTELQRFDKGSVVVDIYTPDKELSKIKKIFSIDLPQDYLVTLLQTGMMFLDNQESTEPPSFIDIFEHVKNLKPSDI